jgi:hypothetical protein
MTSSSAITHASDGGVQAPTVSRLVPNGLAPLRRAVSTTVRMAASPLSRPQGAIAVGDLPLHDSRTQQPLGAVIRRLDLAWMGEEHQELIARG